MRCIDIVFRCFKTLEKAADVLTGAAGPFFVSLAVVLLSLSVVTFFNVLQPDLPWPWISTPISILIALNIFANYYYACTVPPGFVDHPPSPPSEGLLWARRRNSESGLQWTEESGLTKARITQCRKCGQPRPDRGLTTVMFVKDACSNMIITVPYVLKVPYCAYFSLMHVEQWINQCVGLHNERYFVLFMFYLVLGSLFFAIAGFRKIWGTFDMAAEWEYTVPAVLFVLVYVLSTVLSLAVGVMLAWHLTSVCRGETTVESHDHDVYRKNALTRGETFVNSYDMGSRRNLSLYFNVGRNGYPLWVLLLPLKTSPYTDGWSWVRRPGLDQHVGVRAEDEITDDDE